MNAINVSSLPLTLQQLFRACLEKDPQFSLQNFDYSQEGLVYKDPQLGELKIDILNDSVNYQRQGHRGKQEIIAKAVGLNKGNKTIFDATFGLGQDALFLMDLGAQISGCERHPVIWLLMKEALLRADKSIELILEDAMSYLKVLSESPQKPDVVYLDPMFPHKKKSALPRKEMQIFRKIAGDDIDSEQLLSAALSAARDRVVVKRPLRSPDLGKGKIHSFEGTTVRYDIYKVL